MAIAGYTIQLLRSDDREKSTLPHVLAAGTGDCVGGKFLFQRLPTNWTFFLPHNDADLFF
jgi:hypothetical protein